VRAGLRVAILDREQFPRTKLCAGWITPEAVADLELDRAEYPHRFVSFDHLVMHVFGLRFRLRTVQHSIRRFEFDDYLLTRSGAEVVCHNVREIAVEDGDYVVDGLFRAPYLVGAGGTRCPVYRTLFRETNPRVKGLQTTTYEHELAYDWQDPDCHLWFFRRGLPGYSWYVPKADGYLNCGVGGVAEALKAGGQDIKRHWHHHVDMLEENRQVTDAPFSPTGYSYFLRDHLGSVRHHNAFIVGDAVGLATRDLGEGIGPAVASGRRAARSIITGSEYSLDSLDFFSLPAMVGRDRKLATWIEKGLRRRFGLPPAISGNGTAEVSEAVA
jgi:flavin-dependent dehydrogenase